MILVTETDRIRIDKVTGGAHGIGRCIAMELAAAGCKVAVADIDGGAAQKMAERLRAELNVESAAYDVNAC